MKTFTEYFEFFRKNYSLEKLYLKRMNSSDTLKNNILFVVPLIFCIVGISLSAFNTSPIWGYILFTISVILYACVFFSFLRSTKKDLKDRGLPYSRSFYKWKTPELEIERIKYISEQYKDVNVGTIKKLIEITNQQITTVNKDIFADFEKIMDFFGKNYILLIVGVFIGMFNKSEYTDHNFNILIRFISFMFIISAIIALYWKYHLKSFLTGSYEDRKEQYKDYVFVLENILLMREGSSNEVRD